MCWHNSSFQITLTSSGLQIAYWNLDFLFSHLENVIQVPTFELQYMRPTRLWPRYFLFQPEEIFFVWREKLKNLTFLGEILQTQTINGWTNPGPKFMTHTHHYNSGPFIKRDGKIYSQRKRLTFKKICTYMVGSKVLASFLQTIGTIGRPAKSKKVYKHLLYIISTLTFVEMSRFYECVLKGIRNV